MPRLFHRNSQPKNRTIEMALSDGSGLQDRRHVDLNVFRKHRNILKITEAAYGNDQVDGKSYDGTSPSKVIGTEITKIMGIDKEELAKQGIEGGFQLYIVVDNGNEVETGLPSFLDKKCGKKKLVDLNNYDAGEVEDLLKKLPEGSKIILIWQFDVNRTNDVDLEKSIVSNLPFSNNPQKERDNPGVQPLAPPKAVGDGTFSDVNLPDTSVDLDGKREGEDGKVVSIVETLLFKGTHEDPVDLGMIAQSLVEKAKSFDGTPITLSDLQYVLFVSPKERVGFDAGSGIRFESGVNVSLLEIIGKQQLEKKLGESNLEDLVIDKIQTPSTIQEQSLKKFSTAFMGEGIVANEQNQNEARLTSYEKIAFNGNRKTYTRTKFDPKNEFQLGKTNKSQKLVQTEDIYYDLPINRKMIDRKKEKQINRIKEKAPGKIIILKDLDKKRKQKPLAPLARKAIEKTTLAKKKNLKKSRREFDRLKDSKALFEKKAIATTKKNNKSKSVPRAKSELKKDAAVKSKADRSDRLQKIKKKERPSQEIKDKQAKGKTKEKTIKAVKSEPRKKEAVKIKTALESHTLVTGNEKPKARNDQRIKKSGNRTRNLHPRFYKELLGLGITSARTRARNSRRR